MSGMLGARKSYLVNIQQEPTSSISHDLVSREAQRQIRDLVKLKPQDRFASRSRRKPRLTSRNHAAQQQHVQPVFGTSPTRPVDP